MSSIKCDVLVVGGGPVGCSTARATAKNGLNTILIEEHHEIGSPVQCAEGIGSSLIPSLPFNIPKGQLKWKIDGMYFWADGLAFKKEGGIWSGFSIDRKKWDAWLSGLAKKEGAKILTDTKLISFDFDENHAVKKAVAINKKEKIIFEPTYIVAADGVNSTALDLLNERRKGSIGYVKSYEMKNLKLKYPQFDQLFFGNFAPQAYAYIFPLSKTTANLGVGSIYEEDDLEKLFESFLDIPFIKKQAELGKITAEKSGNAPVKPMSNKIVYENVYLVGDAANQNIKPFIEGNIPGILCGQLLGDFIFNVHKKNMRSSEYENFINRKIPIIKDSQIYADFVYEKTDIDKKVFSLILLGLMAEIIPPDKKEIERHVKKGYDSLRDYILENGGFLEK